MTQRVADDGTIACTDETCTAGGRAVLWALDLDSQRWPIAAHQVTSADDREAVTVCGQTRHRTVYPQGWWETHPGDLPLEEHAIHCRA